MRDPRSAPRITLAIALLALAGAVLAQSAAAPPPPPPPPPDAQPLEPLPVIPPPPGVTADTELEPQVTITRKDSDTIEEARVNGRLVWVKVTPRNGRPYFLVPDGTGNILIRSDGRETGLRVPLWLLLEF